MAAAASMKLSLTVVLLLSALVVSCEIGGAMAAPTCATIRCIQGGYITCENYPEKQEGCACVCAPEDGRNCVLHHLTTGDTVNCSKNKE